MTRNRCPVNWSWVNVCSHGIWGASQGSIWDILETWRQCSCRWLIGCVHWWCDSCQLHWVLTTGHVVCWFVDGIVFLKVWTYVVIWFSIVCIKRWSWFTHCLLDDLLRRQVWGYRWIGLCVADDKSRMSPWRQCWVGIGTVQRLLSIREFACRCPLRFLWLRMIPLEIKAQFLNSLIAATLPTHLVPQVRSSIYDCIFWEVLNQRYQCTFSP